MKESAHAWQTWEQCLCLAKYGVCARYVLRMRHRAQRLEDLAPHLLSKSFHKKIEYTELLEYTHVQRNRRDGFSACVYKTALSLHIPWLKETQRQRSEEQRVNVLVFTLVEKPRCQTLILHVRSAVLRSCSRNVNRSITRNVT